MLQEFLLGPDPIFVRVSMRMTTSDPVGVRQFCNILMKLLPCSFIMEPFRMMCINIIDNSNQPP